jgi:hypothetical protein
MILAAVSPGFALLIGIVVLVCEIVVPTWALVDAANRPKTVFYNAGSNKTVWIVLIVVSWLIGLGFFLAGFYLVFTRPKVRRQVQRLGS